MSIILKMPSNSVTLVIYILIRLHATIPSESRRSPCLRAQSAALALRFCDWMMAARESAEFAEQIIAGTLTLHADRGSSMRGAPLVGWRPFVDHD
jgi:hypothetical protein